MLLTDINIMAGYVIETRDLTKYYGKARGIRGIQLAVEKGEIYGFLGPNGAGKTTTIRIILDLIRASSGSAIVFGLDSKRNSIEVHRRTGYIPGDAVFYQGMSGREYLDLVGSFHTSNHLTRREELAEMFELDLDRATGAYSRGMKQKLAIIQAFMNDPELYILDEPTLGLDPLMQHAFYDLLLSEKNRGKTIFLSSHILPEVERVSDRVGIVKDGELVSIESVAELKRKKIRHVDLYLTEEIPAERINLSDCEIIEIKGRQVRLKFSGQTPKLLEEIRGLPLEDIALPEASIEDTFMEFYGGSKEEV